MESCVHLLERLQVIEARIRELVSRRRATDPTPDDPFRGLYLSDDAVDRLLNAPRPYSAWSDRHSSAAWEARAHPAAPGEAAPRLRHLSAMFALDPVDIDLLMVAVAPDVEPRFEAFFGYLNDDVSRRRPTVAVALDLAGLFVMGAEGYKRLLHGPLVASGLVVLEEPERPFATRALRVPDRVSAYLLGDDALDPCLLPVLDPAPELDWGDVTILARALDAGVTLAYLKDSPTGSARLLAAKALRSTGRCVLMVDLSRLARQADPGDLAGRLAREARLSGAGIVAGPMSAIAGQGTATGRPAAADLLACLYAEPQPVLLTGDTSWDPAWTQRDVLQVDVPNSTEAERAEAWRAALAGVAVAPEAVIATTTLRMRPDDVVRAAAAARLHCVADGSGTVSATHIQAGIRACNGSALERLARRVRPAMTWADLVLPPVVLAELKDVALRARHREQVLGEWGMRPGGDRGVGVAALFAGESGTGKTMSAEVIANDLGLDLYVVDLAAVVDKYIGETEKNLERIFLAAAGLNAVLLFDEADAVFGKRSEVRDSHDRYANLESAYLLQRMESFDGLVLLSSNLRANIDEAFSRRLDLVVDFPMPDVEHRRAIWDICLGTVVERESDVDLAFLADTFDFPGGSIRSAAVTAAYLAAADGGVIGMAHLISAVDREYRKLGRWVREADFGSYRALAATGPEADGATTLS